MKPWKEKRNAEPVDVTTHSLQVRQVALAMPGKMLEWPGYFRLSLTASDEMIERSLPGFERALANAKNA